MTKKKNKKRVIKHNFIHQKETVKDLPEKEASTVRLSKKELKDPTIFKDLKLFSAVSLSIVFAIGVIYFLDNKYDVLSLIFQKLGL